MWEYRPSVANQVKTGGVDMIVAGEDGSHPVGVVVEECHGRLQGQREIMARDHRQVFAEFDAVAAPEFLQDRIEGVGTKHPVAARTKLVTMHPNTSRAVFVAFPPSVAGAR